MRLLEVDGCKVINADADLVGSAALLAVTVTVCWVAMDAGAVYKPDEETFPTAGDAVQLTVEFDVPPTEADSCLDWPAFKLADVGDTATATGTISVIVALALLLESAVLVAVTCTVR